MQSNGPLRASLFQSPRPSSRSLYCFEFIREKIPIYQMYVLIFQQFIIWLILCSRWVYSSLGYWSGEMGAYWTLRRRPHSLCSHWGVLYWPPQSLPRLCQTLSRLCQTLPESGKSLVRVWQESGIVWQESGRVWQESGRVWQESGRVW